MNNTIFFFFYNLTHKIEFFDKLVVFTADIFPYIVVIFAILFLLIHHDILPSKNSFQEFIKKWKEIFFVFFTSGIAWFLAKILKILIHTDRPFVVFPQIQPLLSESGFAFPSGHATFLAALAVSLFFCHKKVGYLFMFFALLIGLARIIAGVHFPIDILGGFILGSAVAYFLKNV